MNVQNTVQIYNC